MHVTEDGETLVTSHSSSHTRTRVCDSEKPLPTIVRIDPPASDVTLGVRLAAVRRIPCTVGRLGSPRAAPHDGVARVTV